MIYILWGSAIFTIIIMFAILLADIAYQTKMGKKNYEYIENAISAIIYNFFVFVFLVLYMIGVIIFDNMNPFVSALLLALCIWGASQLAYLCIKEERIRRQEKEFSIVLSAIEISVIFFLLSKSEDNPAYNKYIFVSLAIIIGFFVSLDVLVQKNSILDVLRAIGEAFKFHEARKGMLAIPTVCLSIIIVTSFLISKYISKEVQHAITYGITFGCILFLVIILGLMINTKSREFIQKKIRKQ